ncbi:pilus assembly protein TadG-related protein [Marinibacterium sp. SX1]|uniref:TadE/TadG family type IV pilus assembly protein n=1 Tax=Marinibacterium sp. SX1 TaxID=3388424 RepID=UPI003D185AA6
MTRDVKRRLRRMGLGRFARDESGVMVIFAIYIFLMMLIIGGIGIDVMRFERDRTMVQYTLDRAVLAAADLDQQLDPAAVVRDYFEKANIGEYLSEVTVDEGLGYRVVSGSAQTTFATQFMHMAGVDTLTANAASTAEERIDGVEISLVLDVSGSMNSNNRLTNLKTAAKDFVDEMFDNSEEGKVSISVVPYATQVSVPENVWGELTTTNEADYATVVAREAASGNIPGFPRCINFESSDFQYTSMSLTHEYERTMFFDPWYDYDGRGRDPMRYVTLPVCDPTPSRELVILEDDRDTLRDFIDDMWGGGNTSIDIGMKWGVALIDPSLQPVVTELIGDGDISGSFAGRPLNYDDSSALKVIVLMTDGENTAQYYLNDGFRAGPSNIWWNESQEVYSVYTGLDTDDEDNDGNTNEPLFYWPHNNSWQDHAYGEGTYEETNYEYECTSYKRNGSCRKYKQVATTVVVDEPGVAEEVSYADLWAFTTMEEVVEALYEPWMNDDQAWNDWYYDARSYVNASTKNSRVSRICDAVKEENVIVFTIGFEAPPNGEAVLQDCASSPAHYFDVEGLEISDAFSAIASSIRQLRLTQ